MTRVLLVVCGLALSVAASARLFEETRYVVRGRQPISRLLAADEGSRAGVVFVFQPEDCLSSGEMIVRWNTLYREGKVPVRGLVVGDGSLSEQQLRVVRDFHVTMPVRGLSRRDAAIIGEKLGYTETPFAIVLDRQGRVTASFPAERNVPPSVLRQLVFES